MWLDHFDGIFVINLPERADRRREIDQQLQRIGLSLKHRKVTLFPAVRPDAAGGFPTIGARGCFMSHLGVLQMAHARGMGNILILEDDCDFSKNLADISTHLEAGLRHLDWSFFYGGALNDFKSHVAQPGLETVLPSSGLMGAHCFAVRDVVIPGLAKYLEDILDRPPGSPQGGPMHVDGAYSWFRKDHPELMTLISVPELAFQRSSATDIHQKKWYDLVPIVRDLTAIFRVMKNKWRVL